MSMKINTDDTEGEKRFYIFIQERTWKLKEYQGVVSPCSQVCFMSEVEANKKLQYLKSRYTLIEDQEKGKVWVF